MTTLIPVVTIGGMNAQVEFSGMTPGNAALYPVNAVLPNTSTGRFRAPQPSRVLNRLQRLLDGKQCLG